MVNLYNHLMSPFLKNPPGAPRYVRSYQHVINSFFHLHQIAYINFHKLHNIKSTLFIFEFYEHKLNELFNLCY